MRYFIKQVLTLFVVLGASIAYAQPAPQLTELMVYEVFSPSGGTERIDPYQLSTNRGHSGTTILFKTTERGIGASSTSNGQIAKFNGVTLSWTARRYIFEGGLTVGFEYDWTYAGTYVSGGFFTYENISINYPYTKKYASLTVLPYYPPPVFALDSVSYFSSYYESSFRREILPAPASYQYQVSDPDGGVVTYSLETALGGSVTNNIQISSSGFFTWDGRESSIFTRSTSCPYPYNVQINVVARTSHGIISKWLVTLNVLVGPLPQCAPPPVPA